MAKTTDAAAKWLAAMTSPTTSQNYTAGIQGYQGNPMQQAADAQDRYLAGVQDAVQSGRMKQALMNTPVSVWKNNAANKGAQRLSSGAQAAQQRVQAHFAKWGPIYQAISQQVQSMPKGGMANAMARVQAAYSALKQAAGKAV